MKKKFYGALLLGSLFLAGGMVSCSDYDDDINSLNERVDALEKTVAELQKPSKLVLSLQVLMTQKMALKLL